LRGLHNGGFLAHRSEPKGNEDETNEALILLLSIHWIGSN